MSEGAMPPIWLDALLPVWIEMQDGVTIRAGAFLKYQAAIVSCPSCGATLMAERNPPSPVDHTLLIEVRSEDSHYCPSWARYYPIETTRERCE